LAASMVAGNLKQTIAVIMVRLPAIALILADVTGCAARESVGN